VLEPVLYLSFVTLLFFSSVLVFPFAQPAIDTRLNSKTQVELSHDINGFTGFIRFDGDIVSSTVVEILGARRCPAATKKIRRSFGFDYEQRTP
jgi:hypothetical protein